MTKIYATLFILLFYPLLNFAQQQPVVFVSEPTLSPDGKTILFSYENDLWKVGIDGGIAYRITAMQGKETLPRFSPDGKWITFSGTQDGNNNIYLMPSAGGEIKQLTWHDGEDLVDTWSWDSKLIYFNSGRQNSITEYSVSIEGGTPKRIFDHYHNTPHHLIQDPIHGTFIFTESLESSRYPMRKRYKGDNSPRLLAYNNQTNEFKVLTSYKGKDMWPTIDQKGNLYFVSDEKNLEYNLYTLKNGKRESLTSFATSIKRPQVSANGEKVVFTKDYQLYIFDVLSGKSSPVAVYLNSNNTLPLNQGFNVKDKISNFDVAPDNKKIAFVSRGELFVSDIEGKFIRQMTTNPKERVTEVKWLTDNATLLYAQTTKGWTNWFTLKVDGTSESKQITSDEKSNRSLVLDKKRTKGVYYSGRDEMKLIDLASLKIETIVTDEFWGIQNSEPNFSPDGNYIVFPAKRKFENDLFIYSLKDKKTQNITNTGLNETAPFWSPDGRYIYFSGNRSKVSYPRGQGGSKVYRIPLFKFGKDLRTPEFDHLFSTGKKAKDTTAMAIRFDLENSTERWEEIPVGYGNQAEPYVTQQKEETIVLYLTDHEKGEMNLYKTVYKPFEGPKTEKVTRIGSGLSYVENGTSLYILNNGNIAKLNPSSGKIDEIKIDFPFTRNLSDEFSQIFYEAWSAIKENYYDEKYHSVNWDSIRIRYEKVIPFMHQRDNLREVLNDMLGELNSSHMGFSSTGTEERTYYTMRTLFPGLLFENEKPFIVKSIVPFGQLDLTDQLVKPGDELVAINNNTIDPLKDRDYYFTNAVLPEEVKLTFRRNNDRFDVTIKTQPAGILSGLLYDDWIRKNKEYTSKQSKNKIIYTHMKAMGDGDLAKFVIEMTSNGVDKEGVILDLRYNKGGNVHDEVLNFLSQRPYLQWKYREGAMSPQPNFAPATHPIVLLINEQSLSDAEMTAAGFKQLKLGKIIGTESYRWLIFTSAKGLVDGSSVRLPSWGCYTLDGKDIEKEGVTPDIYVVQTFKDRIEGKDPQLDAAINEIMKQLK